MAGAGRNILSDDFSEVHDYLTSRGIFDPSDSEAKIKYARLIHKYTYSLNLWRFRLEDIPEHGKLFLDELASDAIQVLPQSLEGYNKTTGLLIRGIIENLLKHLYFSDHPVEFFRLNRDRRWYLTTDQLFEYARNHYHYIITEPKFDALSQLSSLYSELSEIVHARAVRNLETRTVLATIKSSDKSMKRHSLHIAKCAQAANFLLAIFHRNQMKEFAAAERRIILRAMPPQARAVWIEYEQDR
jgi:hypothetical protein